MGELDDADLSIVVPSARHTPNGLLRTLLDQARDVDELILVKDTFSHDSNWSVDESGAGRGSSEEGDGMGTGTWKTDDRTRIEHTQGGAAVARNTGWKTATNDRILFLDDDVIIPNGFLEAVRKSLSRNRDSLVIGFRIVSPQPKSDWEWMGRKTLTVDRGPEQRTSSGEPVRIHNTWLYGSGGTFVAKRSALEQMNGFKRYLGAGRLFGGTEDTEFLWHASHHGPISYDGEVSVVHPHPETREGWADKLVAYGRGLGFLAGAIETGDSIKHALGYCTFIREALDSSEFPKLSDKNQRFAKQSIDAAVTETIRTLKFSWESVSMTVGCTATCLGGTE